MPLKSLSKVYGLMQDEKSRKDTISNCRDMVSFLTRKCDHKVKVKVAFLIPWGEDHWMIRPEYYEDLFDCWRGHWNLFSEESEVAVQSDAEYLDLFVDILVSESFFLSAHIALFLHACSGLKPWFARKIDENPQVKGFGDRWCVFADLQHPFRYERDRRLRAVFRFQTRYHMPGLIEYYDETLDSFSYNFTPRRS